MKAYLFIIATLFLSSCTTHPKPVKKEISQSLPAPVQQKHPIYLIGS